MEGAHYGKQLEYCDYGSELGSSFSISELLVVWRRGFGFNFAQEAFRLP